MSEITYTKHGDYLIPDLLLPSEPVVQLGKYALMRKDYLKQYKRTTYVNLLTQGKLNTHLYEVEKIAIKRVEQVIKKLAKTQGVTEELKAKDSMKWVGLMNNVRNQAEEAILKEFIYY